MIFEFKRYIEDCSAQLKCQAEKLLENGSRDAEIIYVDFNWRKIVKTLLDVLSLQKQINLENQFTLDLVKFLQKRKPDWFPSRPLRNIPFPSNDKNNDPNKYYLNQRLNQIKPQIFGIDNIKEISGKSNRLVLSVDWGYANEIHIRPYSDSGGNFLGIEVFPGDTKAQGKYLFGRLDKAKEWPNQLNGYVLISTPYLKFSHFNSGIFWYRPKKNEYKITHTKQFFDKYAGRYQKSHWNEFETLMDEIAPNWRIDSNYKNNITDSNRTYFDLSIGIKLTVCFPYEVAQKKDNVEDNSELVEEIKNIILNLRKLVEEAY